MNRIGEVGDDPDLPRAALDPVPSDVDRLRAENKELHLRLARLQGQLNASVPLAVLRAWANEQGDAAYRAGLDEALVEGRLPRFDVMAEAKGRRKLAEEIALRCLSDGEGWPHWPEPGAS